MTSGEQRINHRLCLGTNRCRRVERRTECEYDKRNDERRLEGNEEEEGNIGDKYPSPECALLVGSDEGFVRTFLGIEFVGLVVIDVVHAVDEDVGRNEEESANIQYR